MCGICGVVSKQTIDFTNLKVMNDSLYHRGPDDSGEEIFHTYSLNYGLAQRRLSIMDLSVAGHQPMHSIDDKIILAFNGEIYNFKKIKEQLNDYSFKSNCDTEVIIAAYKKWGIDCVQHFNGMFAIALLDLEKEILYLVRDRFGKKPLYYYYDDENFVFGSELKPIMLYKHFKKELNQDILGEYFTKQYIASPNTIFKNVYKVKPGEIITYSNQVLKKEQYWDFNLLYQTKKNTFKKSYKSALKELQERLKSAISYRMIADVPIGILLSGGYDSTLITAIAQEISPKKLKTYTIGFNDKKLNEAQYAKEIAKYLGTDHHELYISESDMLKLVKDLPKYYDEPFADSSEIATMLVSQIAKQDVTVALGGDGADELFGGYNTHKLLPLAQLIDPFGLFLYSLTKLPIIGQNIFKYLPISFKLIVCNRNKKYKTQFEKYQNLRLTRLVLKISKNELFDETYIKEPNWQKKRMVLDTQTYLPDDIMCKVDRASMSCSLETRAPYLDVKLSEFAVSIPQKYKFYHSKGKRIIKDLTHTYIPKKIMNRPKSGFSVPIGRWLQNELKNELLHYCNTEFLIKQNIFNVKEIQGIINVFLNTPLVTNKGEKYDSFIWSFFVFQQWYERYFLNYSNKEE